jgi:nucleoside-diphosphate-sugar epimerase
MSPVTLLTGADGYLGRATARALLAERDDRLLLAVRPGPDGFAAKRDRLWHALGEPAAGRVTIVPADLREDGALDGLDPEPVTQVVHAAAVTRFNAGREEAETVNLRGTAQAAAFAARCPRLQRFTLLSTLYTAGRHTGEVYEKRHDEAGFANNYEWSKWAAEDLLWEEHGDLPCSVLRLPTVIADDDSGRVVQQNAFHNTLKLYYYGLLSLVPGDRGTPLNFGTARFTVAAIMQLLDPAVPEGVYHACPGPEAVADLGTMTDTVFGRYERDEGYRRRKLLRPIYCDQDSFYDLIDASYSMRGGPIYDAMLSVAPFARQLYLPKTFRNDALRAVWPGYRAPDPAGLIAATTDWLVATRWGRNTLEDA